MILHLFELFELERWKSYTVVALNLSEEAQHWFCLKLENEGVHIVDIKWIAYFCTGKIHILFDHCTVILVVFMAWVMMMKKFVL